MSIPTATAIITFRNEDGSEPLASIWDIFDGTPIVRGETSAAEKFRVYNNYVGSGSVATADDFKLRVSVDDQFLQTNVKKRASYTDWTYELVNGGYIEIRCTITSETGLAPPTGNTFVPFSGTFSGSSFDNISASGSWNFNEYEMRFVIPSGSLSTSGSATPSTFASWVNQSGVLA